MDRWSIGEVAALFGLKTSALRYWEDQGLLEPSGRKSGRRVYDQDDLRRITLIATWRNTGLMELQEIRVVLNGGSDTRTWRQTVQARMNAINAQRERLDTAHNYLAQLATCPCDHPAATCPHLARQVDETLTRLAACSTGAARARVLRS